MQLTVMVWVTVPDSLPHTSTAFQVLVRVEVPVQLPGVVTSLTSTTLGAGAQLSVAVGAVNSGPAGQVGRRRGGASGSGRSRSKTNGLRKNCRKSNASISLK